MKYGIRDKVTLYNGTVSKMIDNINEILKIKSYTHTKDIPISKKTWDDGVEKYIVNNLKKLNDNNSKNNNFQTVRKVYQIKMITLNKLI